MLAPSARVTNIDRIALPWFIFGVSVALLVPSDALEVVPGLRNLAQSIEFVAPKLARVSAVSQFPAVTTAFFSIMGAALPVQMLHLYLLRDEAFAFLQPLRHPHVLLAAALMFLALIGYWLCYSPGPVTADLEPAIRGNYLASFSRSRLSLGLVGTALLFLFSISLSLSLMLIQSVTKGRRNA